MKKTFNLMGLESKPEATIKPLNFINLTSYNNSFDHMVKAIGAEKLPTGCVSEDGTSVVYPKELRETLTISFRADGNGETTEDINMNSFMSRIDSVKKHIVNGKVVKYTGVSVYNGEMYPFEINLETMKVKGLFGGRSSQISCHRPDRHCFRISKRWNTYFYLGLVIACFELILAGYEADWASLGVNHKDNSASSRQARNENFDSSNLELYKVKSSLNTNHGLKWWELYKLGITPSFSLYSPFMQYITTLLQNGELTEENVRLWAHKNINGVTVFSYI